MDPFLKDLRFATRRLFARPGLTIAAAVTLALGIGANTAVYSLVRGVLLEPLPYEQPERLVMIWIPGHASDQTHLSPREWVEYRRMSRSFEHLASYTMVPANLTEGAEPERVHAARVTGNTFDALGVGALHGRTFTMAEDVAGSDDVVVLGYHLWQRRFAGDPAVVGRSIRINGRPRTVLGVMPPDFHLPLDYREERPTELWVPAAIDPENAGAFGSRDQFIFGRLRAGVAPAAATAELDVIGDEWLRAGHTGFNAADGPLNRDAVPLHELLTGGVRPALLILFIAVGFILLIACANVTNLLLARSDARRRDVATQAALGATRGRIARELLLESGVLAVMGGLLGIAIAYVGLSATLAFTPVNIIRMRAVAVDAPVLGFSALVAVLVTLLAGSAPAVDLSRVNLVAAMAAGGRGGGASVRKRLRHVLVVTQTALSVVLLIGAGLLLRSFLELRRIDLGFDPGHALTFRVSLPSASYPEPLQIAAFYRQLTDRLEAVPGVRSAAAVRVLPLTNTIGDWSITIENKPKAPGTNPNGDWQVVTPGYFETVDVRLLRCRFFTDADDENAPVVAVIDQNMAARYWPGEDALGKRFQLGDGGRPWATIVGITQPVRHNAVVEEPRTEMYLPHAQFIPEVGFAPPSMTLVLKTTGEPLALLPAVRAEVRALDPALPISEVRSFAEVAAHALAQPRFITLLLGVFAVLALVLAAIGMYGVIAYLSARRTGEIGIRMALGATQQRVVRMVLSEGIALALSGMVLGTIAALWLTRFLATQLYGVAPVDPLTFSAVPVILLTVAAFAAWLPARRAARTSPLSALRS
ncbi:MAG TPA: ABC transporter permease [Longimicrobiales bacterium]|nr:ABC transporter permease [Longimicrobiales bacterium]